MAVWVNPPANSPYSATGVGPGNPLSYTGGIDPRRGVGGAYKEYMKAESGGPPTDAQYQSNSTSFLGGYMQVPGGGTGVQGSEATPGMGYFGGVGNRSLGQRRIIGRMDWTNLGAGGNAYNPRFWDLMRATDYAPSRLGQMAQQQGPLGYTGPTGVPSVATAGSAGSSNTGAHQRVKGMEFGGIGGDTAVNVMKGTGGGFGAGAGQQGAGVGPQNWTNKQAPL